MENDNTVSDFTLVDDSGQILCSSEIDVLFLDFGIKLEYKDKTSFPRVVWYLEVLMTCSGIVISVRFSSSRDEDHCNSNSNVFLSL